MFLQKRVRSILMRGLGVLAREDVRGVLTKAGVRSVLTREDARGILKREGARCVLTKQDE